jgi:N6-L-threonylcarbamoyladenine synthase
LYFIQKQQLQNPDFIAQNLHDLCASVQHSIVNILMKKLTKATHDTQIKHIAIAGGVSANSGLRHALHAHGTKHGWHTYIPAFEYCTDNAAMIAIAAHYKYLAHDFAPQTTAPNPRLQWQ